MHLDLKNTHEDKAGIFMRLLFENDRRIYAYIYVLVPNQAEADDLFQDTLAVMWKKFDTFRPKSDFGAWGVGVAYNIVQNYRRKKHRSRLCFEEDIEEVLEREVKQSVTVNNLDCRIDALYKCLTHLDILDRKIFRLRYQENVSVEAIAERIGVTIKVIYTKLSRTSSMLLRCIRKTLAEQEV